MKDFTIYCDMDGVLADFNAQPNAVERFAVEPNFFEELAPIKENLRAVKTLIAKGFNVKILSTSPNARANNSKRKWLAKHLPNLTKEQIIFVRPETPKIKALKGTERPLAVLIDDYHKNLTAWEQGGGLLGVKITDHPENEFEFLNVGYFVKVLDNL